MTFADTEINRRVEDGSIGIQPYWAEQLNPASYDLTLHPFLRLTREISRVRGLGYWDSAPKPLDLDDLANEAPYTKEHVLEEDLPYYVIEPGEFLLACSEEYIKLDSSVVARVEGKSSLARVGLVVHVTGGFIDPGFEGQVTLEIANLFPRPIKIYSGMRIAQIAFQKVDGTVLDAYDKTGHYLGQQGPTESRYRNKERPVQIYACVVCDWKGSYHDWKRVSGETRHCPGCRDSQMVCRDDHCLECGANT